MTLVEDIREHLQEDFADIGLKFRIYETEIEGAEGMVAETIIVENIHNGGYQALSADQIKRIEEGHGLEVYGELHEVISRRRW